MESLKEFKVLVIDDDLDVMDSIKTMLVGKVGNVLLADSTLCANELLDEIKFHCILLDIDLDGENGGVILKKLRGNQDSPNKNTPVIVISQLVDENFVNRNASKLDGVLPKPFDASELLAKMALVSEKSS